MKNILRNIIREAVVDEDGTLNEFTVLSVASDPYRLDTPANHTLGQWLRDAYAEVRPGGQRIHVRGLHYLLVGRVNLPDGAPYVNDSDTWDWLMSKVVPAARWLGYLPWSAIRDGRNSEPEVWTPDYDDPEWSLSAGEVELSLPDVLEPRFRLAGDLIRQPWRQVVIAEKSGVYDALQPVCERFRATLCLPAGEVSATMLYDIMDAANDDGRPLVVHQLGDCDPAGHQMAVSTARKLQALRDSEFPDLRVRVHAPALTVEQAARWNLPSTPLKETEKRADRWKAAMGREQTELDAAVALAPVLFARVVEKSLAAYWDTTVRDRNVALRAELEEEANAELESALGAEKLAEIRALAETKLAELEGLTHAINSALTLDLHDVDIEEPDVPDVEFGEPLTEPDEPLFDSDLDWSTATAGLKQRKSY